MNKITCINTAYGDQDIYIVAVKRRFSQYLSLFLCILTKKGKWQNQSTSIKKVASLACDIYAFSNFAQDVEKSPRALSVKVPNRHFFKKQIEDLLTTKNNIKHNPK